MKPNYLLLAIFVVVMQCALDVSGQAIVQIASNGRESFFVKSDGSLWRGDYDHALAKQNERMQRIRNESKQHPQQASEEFLEEMKHTTSANFEPVDLIVSNGVTAVAVEWMNEVCYVKNDGSLRAIVSHDAAFSGDRTFDTHDHSIQIVPGGVTAVACGGNFTIFLKSDGSVWSFGWNIDGPQVDRDDSVVPPTQIVASGVTAIAAGYVHSLFIKSDGSLWGMGYNDLGQLGLGTNMNHTFSPLEIVTSNVVSIAAGHDHSLFIKSNGSLWAMGLNHFGKLGDCTSDWQYRPEQIVSNNVVAATAGEDGSLFLKKDGSLWGMGINWGTDYGEGIEFDSECPTQIFAANNSAVVAGYYYNAQLKTYVSVLAGKFNNGLAGVSSANNKPGLGMTVSLPGSNLITIELLGDSNVRLTYSGIAGNNYALERSSSLSNPNWVSLVTNTAPIGGVLVITNTPDTTMNNFWRIRSVQ